MSRRKDHFVAFSICPHCQKAARVRRNGKMKFHRAKIWNEETQTGRMGRCPGVDQMNYVKVAWRTAEDAERGLAQLRDTLKGKTKALAVIDELAPAEPEPKPCTPNDCVAAVEAKFQAAFWDGPLGEEKPQPVEPLDNVYDCEPPKLWVPE
jgi:hypothetical protein